MGVTVLITGDGKMAGQIGQWIQQSLAQTTRLETYSTLEAFSEALEAKTNPPPLAEGAKPAPPAANPEGEKSKKDDKPDIQLFLIDVDMIRGAAQSWIVKINNIVK